MEENGGRSLHAFSFSFPSPEAHEPRGTPTPSVVDSTADDSRACEKKLQQRKEEYKRKSGTDRAWERRRHQSSSMRKEQRSKLVSMKRIRLWEDETAPSWPTTPASKGSSSSFDFFSKDLKSEEEAAAVTVVEKMLEARDDPSFTKCLYKLRALLSRTSDPPVDAVVSAGALSPLVKVLREARNSQDMLAATWCLTNIAAGTHSHSKAVLEACPYLVTFLSGANVALQEQAAWTLANVAADCLEFRDVIIRNGAVEPLLGLLASEHASVVRTAAFALCHLCRGPGAPQGRVVALGAVPQIAKLLACEDPEIVTETVWLLSYLSTNSLECIKQILDLEMCPLLLEAIGSAVQIQSQTDTGGDESAVRRELVVPAVRVLGNIVCISDEATEFLITQGLLEHLAVLLGKECGIPRAVRKETIWVISNIVGGPPEHVKAVVDRGFVPPLLSLFREAAFDIRKEYTTKVAFALINIASVQEYLGELYAQGITQDILRLIRVSDPDAQKLSLDFIAMILENILGAAAVVQELDGIDAIESLQFSSNPELQRQSTALVDAYWGEDEPEE